MLNRLDLRGAGGDLAARLPRPPAVGDESLAAVQAIIADVRARGDAAVREYTARFDGADIDSLVVGPDELDAAWRGLDPVLREALEVVIPSVRV